MMKSNRLIALFIVATLVLNGGCSEKQEGNENTSSIQKTTEGHNLLTPQEAEEGWELLFDGETTNGWRGYNKDSFPEKGWIVENGELVILKTDYEGGDIITVRQYENFILKLEWKIPEDRGNSGIFYHVLEQSTQDIYWSAPEIQISSFNPDGNPLSQPGALYDLIPPDPQNVRNEGEWNELRIVVDNPIVEHWQNGEKVVEYQRWTPEWFEMVRNSKFGNHPEFGALRKGHIGLQDHASHVRFRNIKVKELD